MNVPSCLGDFVGTAVLNSGASTRPPVLNPDGMRNEVRCCAELRYFLELRQEILCNMETPVCVLMMHERYRDMSKVRRTSAIGRGAMRPLSDGSRGGIRSPAALGARLSR